MSFRVFVGLASLAAIAGCGDGGPGTNDVVDGAQAFVADAAELRILTWDDLLPDGEMERLEKIYEEFYLDLEQQLVSQQPQMLSQYGSLGDLGGIMEGSALDTMPQLGTFNTVDDLNGRRVSLPGFIVPLDVSGNSFTSFLIVPYFGACIHTPPPAPNQIVYALAEPAQEIDEYYYPYWFDGVMETSRYDTELGNAAYTLKLESVRPYE
ncbi:MAG: DUF3299 domain-containing protein [Parvularculaceae bacterium]|nr:DUF3299 domain-containing protein [Parvularculaceae bacterium]